MSKKDSTSSFQSPQVILGIADNHDAGAALWKDGSMVCAINQERIDRKKNSGSFPTGAIDAVLKESNCAAREIDQIIVGTAYTPSAILRLFPQFHNSQKTQGQFSPLLHTYLYYQSILQKLGLEGYEYRINQKILQQKLKKIAKAPITLVDHHQSHAQLV